MNTGTCSFTIWPWIYITTVLSIYSPGWGQIHGAQPHKENHMHALSYTPDLTHHYWCWWLQTLPMQGLLIIFWIVAVDLTPIPADDPQHDVWVMLEILAELVIGFASALESGNHKHTCCCGHKNTCHSGSNNVFGIPLTNITACTYNMLITEQCSVHAQQEESQTSLIAPDTYEMYKFRVFVVCRNT